MNEALTQALDLAERASDAGDATGAQDWLRRAVRLAPGDASVRLRLAAAMLATGDPAAAAFCRALTADVDNLQAWLALAAAELQANASEPAAAALASALSRHASPPDALAAMADATASAAGSPGWCLLDGSGRLVVGLPQRAAAIAVHAHIDATQLRLRRAPDSTLLTARLRDGWARARAITVTTDAGPLLGSPIDVARIARAEGFVDSADGDLHGWAWHPNDAETPAQIAILPADDGAPLRVLADDESVRVDSAHPFARPRGFRVPPERLRGLAMPLRVLGRDGRALTGSPLDPTADRLSAERAARMLAELFPAPGRRPGPIAPIPRPAIRAEIVGGPPIGGARVRPVDIVVPVHGGLDLTLACLDSVLSDLPDWARVVVVDDASPDPAVPRALAALARGGRITLLAQSVNRGFPGAANIGMRHDRRRDVVLLNSDTLVPPGWLARLRDAAYAAPAIGTATPLSNDATIASYPEVTQPNPSPNLARTRALDRLAQRANAGHVVDLPTGIGFCMYIKRDCLDATGLFREDVFAQGYGEENDFCLRARHLGWRHVAVPGIFVGHVGGQSFGAAKQHLIARNLRLLNRLHPGYEALITAFQRADPMAEPRRRLDAERWKQGRAKAGSVLLVTHGRSGGVQRRVAERAAALRAEGLRPIVVWPVGRRDGAGRDCVLGDGPEGGTPNLRFHVPEELPDLVRLLKADRPLRAEVHHLVGHDHALLGLFDRLAIPYDVVVHDYAWFCPRINLVGAERRYCGEPEVQACAACVADAGATNEETIAPAALRARSAAELGGASRVVVPSQDVATRIRRHFPAVAPQIVPWEDDATPPRGERPPMIDGVVRIGVIGAIGIEKGYEVLLACARDAAERDLKLAFRLVGYSCDDGRLLATGRVHITGAYAEHEAVGLLRAQRAQLAWLPSLWPETWCYTLTQAWQAGLPVAAFDLGTPAERIRRTGAGWVFPVGMPPATLNAQFLRLAQSLTALQVDPARAASAAR